MNKALILSLAVAASVTATLSAQQNISPAAQALISARQNELRSPAAGNGSTQTMVRAFLTYNSPAALDSVIAAGGTVGRAAVDGMVTVSIPVGQLERIAALPQIDFLEVGANVNLLNNNVRSQCKVNDLHTGENFEMPYTGKGVVLGVIDTGLEFSHIAFRENDGQTSRIRRVWVQDAIGRAPDAFGYGAEYSTPEEITGAIVDSKVTFHATHVTGIAAGSNTGLNKYYGMAPETDIVFVSFSTSNSVGVADAISYIFDYADEVNKPCVINMSLGSHQGPHDGTSTIDRTIDALTGPGRIIVGAAGNEGTANLHVSKEFTDDDTTLKTMLAKSSSEVIGIDIWGEADAEVSVKLGVVNHLTGRMVAESDPITADTKKGYVFFDYDETGADITYFYYPSLTADGRTNIFIEAHTNSIAGNKMACVTVEGEPGSTVHMWNVGAEDFTSGGRPGWTNGDQNCSVGELGGTANSIISVGSFNTCHTFYPYFDPDRPYQIDNFTIGAISDFSSKGPTADGRTKPDVLAGGQIVVSAVSQHASTEFSPNNSIDLVTDSNGKKYYYGLNAGTSMASPAVAGIVALWLQANPNLTPDDIRECIRQSANRDRYCGHVPNNQAGLGKIDATKGMQLVLNGTVGCEAPEINPDDARAWTSADGSEICIVSPVAGNARIVSVNGSGMLTAPVSEGFTSIATGSLAKGIYIVSLPDGSAIKLAI